MSSVADGDTSAACSLFTEPAELQPAVAFDAAGCLGRDSSASGARLRLPEDPLDRRLGQPLDGGEAGLGEAASVRESGAAGRATSVTLGVSGASRRCPTRGPRDTVEYPMAPTLRRRYEAPWGPLVSLVRVMPGSRDGSMESPSRP